MTLATLTRSAKTLAFVRAGEMLNRTFVLPLLIFYATSRCNSRCVSCDWWRSAGDDDLTLDEIDRVAGALPSLGTRVVVFSGGEPLLRPDVFNTAALFAGRGIRLHLLTSGVLLERVADRVARNFERVTISLDATTPELYRSIRGVAALGAVEAGVTALRRSAARLPITARATLHRLNFRELPALIAHARRLGVDGISFLPADTTSDAFGRASGSRSARDLSLTVTEIDEFREIVDRTIRDASDAFASGFVAESPDRLRRIVQYYEATAGLAPFAPVACNAPWISAVLEANGDVRPCFFHEPVGSIRREPLTTIVTEHLPAFRRTLDIGSNAVCERCVCSIRAGWRSAPWN